MLSTVLAMIFAETALIVQISALPMGGLQSAEGPPASELHGFFLHDYVGCQPTVSNLGGLPCAQVKIDQLGLTCGHSILDGRCSCSPIDYMALTRSAGTMIDDA